MVKKTRTSADDVLRMMYPDLPTSDDFEQKKEPAKDDAAATIAQLQAQIAELKGVVSVSSRQTTTATTRQEAPPVAPVHNYDQAPDPAVDPKGYAAFVLAESRKDVEYEKQLFTYQQRQASTQANRVGTLWQDFTSQYGDYAKEQDRVEIAATRVAERARAKGLDVDQYMYGNSGQFMEDVVKEIDKLWPKADKTTTVDDEDDDDEDNRGVFVSPQGAASGQGGKRSEPPAKFGALGTAITDWQEKTGFHR